MKKFFFFLFLVVPFLGFTQRVVATYEEGSYTFNFTDNTHANVLEGFSEEFGWLNVALDSVTISDNDPNVIDSVSYLVYWLRHDDGVATVGFELVKTLDENRNIKYIIDDNTHRVARTWKCEATKECRKCKPERNWFLGPVVGCGCDDLCNFSTAGGGGSWLGAAISFVSLIIAIL